MSVEKGGWKLKGQNHPHSPDAPRRIKIFVDSRGFSGHIQLSYISKDQAIFFVSPSPKGVILLSSPSQVFHISESSFSYFILNNKQLLLFTLAVDQNPLGSFILVFNGKHSGPTSRESDGFSVGCGLDIGVFPAPMILLCSQC